MIPPRNSGTVHDAPWDFIRYPQFLLTHQLLYVSPHKYKSKDVNMTNGVAKDVELDDQFNHFHWSTRWHVDRNATDSCVAGTFNLTWGNRPSVLRKKRWQVLWETQAKVWCSTSLTINILILWSQTSPHYSAAKKRVTRCLKWDDEDF